MKKFICFICFIFPFFNFSQTITTVAGTGNCCYYIDGGPATNSDIYYPTNVVVNANGDLFICTNNAIRKVNAAGTITTVAGTGLGGYTGDGGLATSAQIEASSIAVDPSGNIYISDWYNKVIRKVNTLGVISTISGTGTTLGDGGPANQAKLFGPYALHLDLSGNLYIADGNRIRKINTSGIIHTVAGTGNQGSIGDGGPAISAELSSPFAMTTDVIGNLYISDNGNNKIRKVDPSGIITTIAGTGTTSGFSGDLGPAVNAQLAFPFGISLDALGRIYISDAGNNRIRVINTSGIIDTYAGDGTFGYAGDDGPLLQAEFKSLQGLFHDPNGILYVTEHDGHRIRKIVAADVGIKTNNLSRSNITIYPNPVKDKLTIDLEKDKRGFIKVFGNEGKLVISESVKGPTTLNIDSLNNGIYFIQIKTDTDIITKKIIINK